MPTLPAHDNLFPSVLLAEAASPGALTPGSTGQRRLVVGTDGLLYVVNSAGVAVAFSAVPDPIFERFGAPDTAHEFTASSLAALTALGTPDAEDANTSVPGAYYVADNAAATAWCGRHIAAPGVFPYTVVARVKAFNPKVNYNAAGLWVGDATPKMSVVNVRAAARTPVHELFTNPTTFSSLQATGAMTQLAAPFYLALAIASTTSVTSYVSSDGYVWERLASATNPAITITRVGIALKSENAGGTAAAFDYLRVWNSAKTFLTGI
jgi:hypothetical protein